MRVFWPNWPIALVELALEATKSVAMLLQKNDFVAAAVVRCHARGEHFAALDRGRRDSGKRKDPTPFFTPQSILTCWQCTCKSKGGHCPKVNLGRVNDSVIWEENDFEESFSFSFFIMIENIKSGIITSSRSFISGK